METRRVEIEFHTKRARVDATILFPGKRVSITERVRISKTILFSGIIITANATSPNGLFFTAEVRRNYIFLDNPLRSVLHLHAGPIMRESNVRVKI